ncbi:MAG: DNRLRE domain-containing protein, partial [Blautia sp.]|nr:DNRLRE domain-containing protein [Blautia sp.]
MNINKKLASMYDAEIKNEKVHMEPVNKEQQAAAAIDSRKARIIGERLEKRSPNVKVFEREDHSTVERYYFSPVHYKAADGSFQEISRELKLEETANTKGEAAAQSIAKTQSTPSGTSCYANRNGSTVYRFAQTASEGFTSGVERDGKSLRWGLLGGLEVTAEPAGANTLVYSGILPKTDLVCRMGDLKAKEDLVLRDASAPHSFTYLYEMEGLVPKQEEGRIAFYDAETYAVKTAEPMFTLTAPVMKDADEGESDKLALKLETDGKTCKVTLTADEAWLTDPSRVYPVTIDPVTSTSLGVTDIYDTYIDTNAPGTQYHTGTRLYTKGGTRLRRSLLYFPLPELSSGDMVTAANLVLVSSSTDNASKTIEAHRILTKWDWHWTSGTSNTWTTWNNSPLYEEAPLDVCTYTADTLGKCVNLDITRAVKQATADSPWYGILLKGDYELAGTAEFLSSDHEYGSSNARPHIDIAYLNCSGLEDYWTYHSQEVGRAGTVHVNDCTGNLILVHDTASLGGSRLPLALSHIYNSNDRKKDTGYGYGWRLSYQQTLEGELTIGGTKYYKHTDADGAAHYFSKVNNVWKDETDPETTLTVNSSGTDRYVIKDHENNQLVFDASKRLIKIRDNNYKAASGSNEAEGSEVVITYNSDNRITKVTDGATRTATLTYNADKQLTRVVTPLGTKTFTYSGKHLVKIKDVDGKECSYTYNTGGHYLTAVSDWTGYTVVYRYYTQDTVRVKDIREYRNPGIQPADKGNSLTLTYGYNTTKFVDGDERAEIYRFNNQGNVVSIHDGKGHAASAKYGTTGNHVNRLLNATKLQETVVQLVQNPMIEAPASGSTVPNWTGTVYNTTGSTTLNSDAANCKAGSHSLKSVNNSTAGEVYWSQDVSAIRGRKYTLSAYVKADITEAAASGGVRVRVKYKTAASTYQYESSALQKTTTNGFIRLSFMFPFPSNAYDNTITVLLSVSSAKATAYWDMVQLEEGTVPNRVNLVTNGTFYTGSNSGFSRNAMETEDAVTTLNTNNSVSFRLPMAITAATAKVYNKPDTTGTVLETLSKGALVCGMYYEPGQTSGTWIKVRTSSGKTGYITSTQAFTYAPGSEIWISGRTALTSTKLYSSANSSASTVATAIPQNTALCIKSTTTGSDNKPWAYVGLTIGGVPKFGYIPDRQIIHMAMNEPYTQAAEATNYLTGPSLTSTPGAAIEQFDLINYQGKITLSDGTVLLAVWKGNKFHYVKESSTFTEGWTFEPADFTRRHQEKVTEGTGGDDTHIYKVVGDLTKNKMLTKTIPIAGSKGDCFMAGGWARGTSLPESTNDTNRRFGIAVTFNHTDNTTDTQRIAFTPDIIDWQYACSAVVAKKAYSSITMAFEYCRQAGQVYFDGLSLFREEFGQSFVYDDKERVTS